MAVGRKYNSVFIAKIKYISRGVPGARLKGAGRKTTTIKVIKNTAGGKEARVGAVLIANSIRIFTFAGVFGTLTDLSRGFVIRVDFSGLIILNISYF